LTIQTNSPVTICPIVEGHGDVAAVPLLLRRIALEVAPQVDLKVQSPIRIPKERLLKVGELERAAKLASLKLEGTGAVLLVLDSERPCCPAQEGPQLLQRLHTAVPTVGRAVVLAHQEAETWFLAAAKSLSGHRGLPQNLEPPPDPAAIRGAKEWLSHQMRGSHPYSETLDQPAFAAIMNLEEARSNDSFDKLWREVTRLLTS
jgi:uncharacterized protein DUF4276